MPKGVLNTDDGLNKAAELVNKGMGVRAAAARFGVPKSTLSRKLSTGTLEKKKRGPEPILGEVEAKIVDWVKTMARMGFPVSRHALQAVGSKLAKASMKGGNKRAEDMTSAERWIRLFCARHPDLALRTPEHLSCGQASLTENDIRNHFKKVESRLSEESLLAILEQPDRVFNTDESGFALNPQGGRVLAERGSRNVVSRGGSEKDNVTVLVTGSAEGVLAPTAILLRRKRVPPSFIESLTEGFCLLKSDSGWMKGPVFLQYLEEHFYPFLIKRGVTLPVLLFLDNHRSHLTMEVSSFCEEKGIILVPLLPNATHMMQPLDVAVFRPLKNSWYQTATKWRLRNGGRSMRIEEFISLLQEAFDEYDPVWLVNGFKRCGISPWDPNAIEYTKLCSAGKPSESAERTSEGSLDQPEDSAHRSLPFVLELEERMSSEQLEFIREQDGDWHGPESMRALYDLWSKADAEARRRFSNDPSSGTSADETPESILKLPTPYQPRRRRTN